MIKPQYSLSFLLKLTAALAVPALVIGRAWQGSGWGRGLCIGSVAAVVALICLAGVFALSYAVLNGLYWLFMGSPAPLEMVPLDPADGPVPPPPHVTE